MIKYSGIYESSTPPPSTKALWVDGGVLKIYKNGSWRPVDDPKSKLTIDSILKAGSTNPVENRAIYSRFIGVDKYIEVNRNNITNLTRRTDEIDGIAKGAEALAKVNEERINAVTGTANTALTNSKENQDSVRNAQVTANEAKASVEGLTIVTKRIEVSVSQLQELINTCDKKLSSGTLRDLYISAGAKYNEATGFYELNGLTDITEEQMRKIYRYAGTPQVRACLAYSQIRTNFPSPGFYNGSIYDSMFYASKIEVINLGYKQTQPPTILEPYISLEGKDAFYLCKNLRIIYGRIEKYHTINDWGLTFGECAELEEVRIYRLGTNIKFSWSPNLSKESVLYMITNANPPSGAAVGSIAITLHPTAYARLKDDADIVAALEAKNGVITLVSA